MATKFEARQIDSEGPWKPVSETFVRSYLAIETPDPEMLDAILADMASHGSEADDATLVYRAVNVIDEADYRVAFTTAETDYLGFGSVVLDAEVGTDRRGRPIRKIGIKPECWDWQTNRFASGLHTAVEPHELDKFRDIWTLKDCSPR